MKVLLPDPLHPATTYMVGTAARLCDLAGAGQTIALQCDRKNVAVGSALEDPAVFVRKKQRDAASLRIAQRDR